MKSKSNFKIFKILTGCFAISLMLSLVVCGNANAIAAECGEKNIMQEQAQVKNQAQNIYTSDTKIQDVIRDPVFEDYGRLLFPVNTGYYRGDTLGNLNLTWYSQIDPDTTVKIANTLRNRASAGEQIFYDIYTEQEKQADPAKRNTGLFFFKGNPGERFAICNAGGGFAYVAAMHDSFPHALELSEMGYNAFALIYRPGAQTACEDLSRAIAFIFEHADELEVETSGYSLWGGSAGARMAATLGTYGPEEFGDNHHLPKPGAVIMQYTGHSAYSKEDPPTYACVGDRDGIADWRIMQRRLDALSALGVPTEFHVYPGLSHGFGLGKNTVAEGWIQDAVNFWEDQFVTPGEKTYRGFVLDNILDAGAKGQIHYNAYIPEGFLSDESTEPRALFLTLPGYEGLYFQGVGTNLKSENFGFEAQKYHANMMILAPQLSDWGETSADQTIALLEYIIRHYRIDPTQVYANGYSGGGETMSIVMGKRPDLITAYLHCSSQWDGNLEALSKTRTPVYLVVGRDDEYYGSEPTQRAYNTLHKLYRAQGMTDSEIAKILVLDIKDREYFTKKGVQNQHGGGNLFASDPAIMGWLFSQNKSAEQNK